MLILLLSLMLKAYVCQLSLPELFWIAAGNIPGNSTVMLSVHIQSDSFF